MLIEILNKLAHLKAGTLLPLFLMGTFTLGGHKIEQEPDAPGDNFPHVFLK